MKWNLDFLKKIGWKKAAAAGIAAAVLGGGGGLWYYLGHTSSDPVYVYGFDIVGMTEYWGDSRESFGPVTTDRIQTVFLSDTQTVNEIKVKEGDTVKKGDVLMTFDTTLSSLAVEKKRLEAEKLKLDLEDARNALRDMNALRPMSSGSGSSGSGMYPDKRVEGSHQIFATLDNDGSTQEKAMVCWIHNDTEITGEWLDKVILEIIDVSQEYQEKNAQWQIPSFASELEAEEETKQEEKKEETVLPPAVQEKPVEENPSGGSNPVPEQSTPAPENQNVTAAPDDPDNTGGAGGTGDSGNPNPEEPVPTEPEPINVEDCYVVFKVTDNNMSRGAQIVWQGYHVFKSGPRFAFYSAVSSDISMCNVPEEQGSSHSHNSGMTWSQIVELRDKQQKEINELELKLKMTEAEFKIMSSELSDGNIYAATDGKVISLQDVEEAKTNNQPVLKVSGGGGFFVQGSVSELERDSLQIGQEVTINDWNTGMTYTGEVTEIRDFPSGQNTNSGSGNPYATQYPFVAFVDESADLREGTFVSVSYTSSGAQNGIYVQKPFIRTERGRSFAYVLGANGRLEEREVVTGKSLWGSYVEVLSGLTAEDKIAFPYGKNVKPGAKAVQGDYSNLYGT